MTKSRIAEHSAPAVGTLRRRALDAARKLLEQGGPEALHLRTIAAKIGCGAASLYYHFTGKDALLGVLAMEGFQELHQAMTKVVLNKEFVRDIDSASAGYLRFMGQNLQLYALMYSEHILANNEAVRDVERHVLEVFQDALRSDDRNDYEFEFPPEFGKMLMFRVNDHSWHGFLPQKGERKSLQFCWVDSEAYAASTYRRHRISALVKSNPILRKILQYAPRGTTFKSKQGTQS